MANMPKVKFYSAKTFPRDASNPDVTFCGSGSISAHGLALNEIKLKLNNKTGKFHINFPEIRGNDGIYRPVYCTITKKGRENALNMIVAAAQKAWGRSTPDQ